MSIDTPVVLGFAGGYATGKTSTANALAPKGRIIQPGQRHEMNIFWDHFYFAMPLYRMASAARDMEGPLSLDRLRYEVHKTIIEAFNDSPLYGAPGYEELIKMVEEIVSIPVPEDTKPREFLQRVGTDICRAYDYDIWVKWMRREIMQKFYAFSHENKQLDPCCDHNCRNPSMDVVPPRYGVVLSDCRFVNEIELVKSFDDHVLIKFTADEQKVVELDEKRGNRTMTPEQSQHQSELALTSVPDSDYDAVIDISNLDLKEQVEATKQVVRSKLGV